jgi:hypothetical protein
MYGVVRPSSVPTCVPALRGRVAPPGDSDCCTVNWRDSRLWKGRENVLLGAKMARRLPCCPCARPRRTFRQAYRDLASNLSDPHLEAAVKRYISARQSLVLLGIDGTFASLDEILSERWPYATDRSSDAEPTLHEELERIELAWAKRSASGRLRRADAGALRTAWAGAAHQRFPFPTAMMLLHAADADEGIDPRSWRLIRELNWLADARMVHSHAVEASERACRLDEESAAAMRTRQHAIEGRGHGRWQSRRERRLLREKQAPPRKLRHGSSAFFTRRRGRRAAAAIEHGGGHSNAGLDTEWASSGEGDAGWSTKKASRRRRLSLFATDLLGTSLQKGGERAATAALADGDGGAEAAGSSQPYSKELPPSGRRSARGSGASSGASSTAAGRPKATTRILHSRSQRRRMKTKLSSSHIEFGGTSAAPLPLPTSLPPMGAILEKPLLSSSPAPSPSVEFASVASPRGTANTARLLTARAGAAEAAATAASTREWALCLQREQSRDLDHLHTGEQQQGGVPSVPAVAPRVVAPHAATTMPAVDALEGPLGDFDA